MMYLILELNLRGGLRVRELYFAQPA